MSGPYPMPSANPRPRESVIAMTWSEAHRCNMLLLSCGHTIESTQDPPPKSSRCYRCESVRYGPGKRGRYEKHA